VVEKAEEAPYELDGDAQNQAAAAEAAKASEAQRKLADSAKAGKPKKAAANIEGIVGVISAAVFGGVTAAAPSNWIALLATGTLAVAASFLGLFKKKKVLGIVGLVITAIAAVMLFNNNPSLLSSIKDVLSF